VSSRHNHCSVRRGRSSAETILPHRGFALVWSRCTTSSPAFPIARSHLRWGQTTALPPATPAQPHCDNLPPALGCEQRNPQPRCVRAARRGAPSSLRPLSHISREVTRTAISPLITTVATHGFLPGLPERRALAGHTAPAVSCVALVTSLDRPKTPTAPIAPWRDVRAAAE
jgi:hypothetical protein